jgi:hypothetical protein
MDVMKFLTRRSSYLKRVSEASIAGRDLRSGSLNSYSTLYMSYAGSLKYTKRAIMSPESMMIVLISLMFIKPGYLMNLGGDRILFLFNR